MLASRWRAVLDDQADLCAMRRTAMATLTDHTDAFRAAICAAGLAPPARIEAGKLHRFPGADKSRGNTAAWCKLFADGAGGVFGDFSRDYSDSWQARREELTDGDREAFRQQIIEAKKQATAERRAQQTKAARTARKLWDRGLPALFDHPYLVAKGAKPYGLRMHNGALAIPLRDASGTLRSLQFIDRDGGKRFLKDARTRGCYHAIGTPDGTICIAEGYATAASVYEATGHAVAVAFSAGNLLPTAEALRKKFPDMTIVIAADDDAGTPGNPGLTKATEAALAVGGLLAIPSFGADRPQGATDMNDLHQSHGLDAVKAAIEAARPVNEPDHCAEPTSEIDVRRADTIEAQPICWLWPGRIARGKVSLIAGHPGLGKSQLVLNMAATVTTGGCWPADGTRAERGSVVILSAEDDAADTIVPRLKAAGADLSRVHILEAVREIEPDGSVSRRPFNLRLDIARLGALLARIGDVRMVGIDPVTAYLGATDSHKNSEIRALLAPLSDMAVRHDCAVVGISHLSKMGGTDALMRIMGSLAFVAAARSAWLVAKDPEDEHRRLFLPLKNNLGADQSGLAFTIESVSVTHDIEACRIAWEPEPVTISANDALAPQPTGDELSALAEAKDFLTGLLADGPMPVRQIRADADGAGHAWATIRRAQQALHIEATKDGYQGRWTWQLPKVLKGAQKMLIQKNMSTFDETQAPQALQDAGSVKGAQDICVSTFNEHLCGGGDMEADE